MCLMSDGLVPLLSGAGIWSILQAPIWLIKHKHLLGSDWPVADFRGESGGEKVREERGKLGARELIRYCVMGEAS